MAKSKIYLLILLSCTLAYWGSLKYGFSQDDYYFLLISQAGSVREVLEFFSPWHQQGFPFFRPLGTQLYYYLFTTIFGVSGAALAMHVFMILVQSLNGYLVYRLVSKLFKDTKTTSVMIGLLYVISSVHFLSLFYIAATQQLLAATFGLLSLIAFTSKKYVAAGLYLIPGILSKESALVIPGIASLIYLYESKIFNLAMIKNYLLKIFPYIFVIALYLGIRLLAGIHIQSEYQPVIGPSLLSTIRWYLLFGYGAPEELLRYGLSGFGIRIGQFISDFGVLGLTSILSTFILTIGVIYRVLTSLISHKPFTIKQVMILMTWFILGIILIVWYPDHRYPHYLDLSLIPLLYLVIGDSSARLKYFMFGALTIASVLGIMISERVHWTTGRAKMVESTLQNIDWARICSEDNLVFVGEGNKPLELSYSLSLSNGPRVICHNKALGVYYQGIDKSWPADAFAVTVK
jgi:hypothetical protein